MQELTLEVFLRAAAALCLRGASPEAIAYVRKRTDLVREVGDWQTLIDMRHADECLTVCVGFHCRRRGHRRHDLFTSSTFVGRAPSEVARTGLLGAAEEWQTWQLQDGREFYVKPSTNDKRWIRPVDAVEENEAVKNCTNITFDFKVAESASVSDRFRTSTL